MGYSGPLNDIPSGDQKDALVGTSGTPSTSNKYVTDDDSRNDDDRTPVAHTEAKHSAAATQTISASNQTIQHNDKSVVLLSSSGLYNTYTLGETAAAIADGSVDGQELLLLWYDSQENQVDLKDNPPTSNCKLQGDWVRIEGVNELWLRLKWNAGDSNWWEVGRGDNSNNNPGKFAGSAGGSNNTNPGQSTGSAGGSSNTNSGDAAGSAGGSHNLNSGRNSGSVGGSHGNAPLCAQQSHAAGRFSATGDAQSINLISRKVITHSSTNWYELYLDGNNDLIFIPTDSVWTFEILIVGTTQGCTKSFGLKIVGVVENDGGTPTILASTVTTIYDTDDTDFDAQVGCNVPNEAFLIQVKDSTAGGDVVRWVAHMKAVCVSFPA